MLSIPSIPPTALLDALPDALVVTDENHQVAYVNERAADLFGYRSGELVGQPGSILLPLLFSESYAGITNERSPLPAAGPYRARRSDGVQVEVIATISVAMHEGAPHHLVSLRPAEGIDGFPGAAEELKLHRALRRSPIVIGTVDRDLRYTWVYNPEPHFPLDLAIGKRDDELSSGEGIAELMAFKREVFDTGHGGERTFEFHLSDEIRSYDIFATPVTDESGSVVEVNTVAIDTSQLRGMMRFQREFVGMIAHDLRQPITAVQIWAQRIARQRVYDEDALDEIIDQTHRMGRMVEDLLDTTAIESGNLQLHLSRFDLVPIVRHVVDYTSDRSRQHRVHVRAPGGVIGLWDQSRIMQVLENLLTNAIKYSPADSEIEVDVSGDPSSVVVSVSDHGDGISADEIDLIFDCFGRSATARQSGVTGLGLGLCIARGIVEAHGGRLTASSDGPGTGSTFSFTLPYQPPVHLLAHA